ncbi:pentatricopeptide repeat-containing protein At2g13600-like [Dioscorea cayenensis subsp. rotundata]|uniref:Pentatricopeptide repeat-containing protein At2g13600-like n=1 Tax=Dioscorea cayennensis subsp. rotundata TaxID=55577 RepID=A0AB40CDS4_DIOCR|nr:pentatricopeptide repeat-containing protein At2g13600-like [Dioscorea cayenensis subsp. rotundata]
MIKRAWRRRLLVIPAPRLRKPPSRAASFLSLHDFSNEDLIQHLWNTMRAPGNLHSVFQSRKIHARLFVLGLESNRFLQNNLLNMYFNAGSMEEASCVFARIQTPNVISWNMMITGLSKLGRIREAREVFDEMPQRDSTSWNTLISGYFWSGKYRESIDVFVAMLRDLNSEPNSFTLASVMKACGVLQCRELGLQLHSFVQKFDFGKEQQIEASLLDMYIKCGATDEADRVFERLANPNVFCWNSMILGCSKSYGVVRALELFNEMPERDVVSWNTMISVLAKHGRPKETLLMIIEMQAKGCPPDSTTYASVLSACTSIPDVGWGRHLHARIIRTQLSTDVFVGSALVDMYAKFGHLETAKRVFESLTDCNAASWTALIGGYAQSGYVEETFRLFNKMRKMHVPLDQFSIVTALAACCSKKDMYLGMQIHSLSIRIGYGWSIPVSNALLSMYAKCGSVNCAESVFQLMPIKDIISWTSMVTAYAHMGDVSKAREFFDSMVTRNVVTWNAMLAAYIQHDHFEKGLKLYIVMLRESTVRPDWVTFATLLSACANSAIWRLGNQVIAHTIKVGLNSDISVANGIITMHSKCGRISEARHVFDAILDKDLVSWNAMITAYAQNGLGKEAIAIFESMLYNAIHPDFISYVAVLSGCSHAGLVAEGKHYFDSMTRIHKISPGLEHYACMVDLLARAGYLEQAKEMIDNMPIKPSAEVWGALLGACKIHGNTTLAEISIKHLLELDLKDSGSYVQLAKLYSDSGKLEDTAEVRRFMKERRIRKNPGCSWIEVKDRIHVFTADDAKHPQINEIQQLLDELIKKIEVVGYKRNDTLGSQKGHHSEMLAVAFGLMNLPEWMPVYVMKNLRICSNCHVAIKLISQVTAKDFVVRDANRFHHFKQGCCSCGDYW